MLISSPKGLGYILAVFATALWAGNYVIARGIHELIAPITLASWRWILAILIFSPFAIKELISQKELVKKHWKYLSITALFGVSLLNTFVYIAGHSTQAIKLSIVTTTAPIFTILLASIINREKIKVDIFVGLVLAIMGILVLMSGGDIMNILELRLERGDLWVLMAAVSFAGYSILVNMKPKAIGSRTFLLSIFIIGWILLIPFHLWESGTSSSNVQDIVIVGSLFYLAIGPSIVAFLAWNKAIALVGPSSAAMIYYSLPIISSIEAAIFLGELITVVHVVSFILIISGIYFADRGKTQ